MREVDGEDGLNTGKRWMADPTPKATRKGDCGVLMWHKQGKTLGKDSQKGQEAKSLLIFRNKM